MLAPGTTLGPYHIIGLLGAGGMGTVFRARDERLQRDVAIKVLPVGTLSDDPSRQRFRKEALALARLSHPNIAAVYDVGQQEGMDYLVMELVPGQSLAARLERGPLTRQRAPSFTLETVGSVIRYSRINQAPSHFSLDAVGFESRSRT